MKMGRLRPWLFRIVFVLVCGWLFLYLLLPAQELKNYLLQAMLRLQPEAEFTIAGADSVFPLGLALRGISWSLKERKGQTIAVERLFLRPYWTRLFSGQSGLRARGLMYGGNLTGDITWAGFNLSAPPRAVKINWQGVDIGRCLYLQGSQGNRLTGILSGTLSFHPGDVKGPGRPVTGQAEFSIKKGVLMLPEKIAGLDKLEFNDLDLRLDFQGSLLKISRLALSREGMRAGLAGTLRLDPYEMSHSSLDLKGTLEIAPGRRFSLIITGKLGAPVIQTQQL